MVVEGGEYNQYGGNFTRLGAIYDPVGNTWLPKWWPMAFRRRGKRIGDTLLIRRERVREVLKVVDKSPLHLPVVRPASPGSYKFALRLGQRGTYLRFDQCHIPGTDRAVSVHVFAEIGTRD